MVEKTTSRVTSEAVDHKAPSFFQALIPHFGEDSKIHQKPCLLPKVELESDLEFRERRKVALALCNGEE